MTDTQWLHIRSLLGTIGCDQGVWPRRMAYVQADPDLSAVRLDSTVGRAHVSAASAPQKKEPDPARSQPGRLLHPDP